MAEDITRNTIYVLVLLTLLISILGTWTVLAQINSAPAPVAGSPHTDSGKVVFGIEEPPEMQADLATANVLFAIESPDQP